MPTYYTVDRSAALSEDQELMLHAPVLPADVPEEMREHVHRLFPEGVTNHWQTWFGDPATMIHPYTENGNSMIRSEPFLELLLEFVRRAEFSERPSRYQSLFAWGSWEEALRWRVEACRPEHPVWR